MKDPLFSIVTVTLNCRTDAAATATSVWRQTCPDYEYIVKDGGSRDGTPVELQRLGGPVSIVVCPDAGIFDAMNQALRRCHGRYVLFLNAGDLLHDENALRAVSVAARQCNRPEVIYTHVYNQLKEVPVKYPARLSRLFLFRRSLNHQGTYVRRDCFARFGCFDPCYPVLGDNEFLARLLLKAKVRAVLCPIVGTLYKDGGFTATPAVCARMPAERARMNRLYFSGCERLLYGLVLQLTLSSLRRRLLSSKPSGPCQKLYYSVSNLIK